jgi:hypothetical protein
MSWKSLFQIGPAKRFEGSGTLSVIDECGQEIGYRAGSIELQQKRSGRLD